MENSSPTYRITTKSGIVVGNDLLRSAPAIRLQEGHCPGTYPKPVELQPGQFTTVVYPLLDKRKLECKVERTDGMTGVVQEKPQEQPKEEPTSEPIAVRRRGRGTAR